MSHRVSYIAAEKYRPKITAAQNLQMQTMAMPTAWASRCEKSNPAASLHESAGTPPGVGPQIPPSPAQDESVSPAQKACQMREDKQIRDANR